MEHFKDKLKLAFMREASAVKTNGVNPATLLAGFYISRKLPYSYHEMNDLISFNNKWESLLPTAKEMAAELSKYCVFGEGRALHYAKMFLDYRTFRSHHVFYSLYNTFGVDLCNTTEDEVYEGITVSPDDKLRIVQCASEAFSKHRALIHSSGYVSAEVISKTYVEELGDVSNRTLRKYLVNKGIELIKKCVNMQMWSMGHEKRITPAYRSFLIDMFDHVHKGCIVDDSVLDFIYKYSVTVSEHRPAGGLNLSL